MIRINAFSLLHHNTFGIDAQARQYIEYASEEELTAILPALAGERFFHIGEGSNLLFTQDYDGVMLHSGLRGIQLLEETDADVVVRVGAGERFDDLIAWSVRLGWSGIENLSHIPGEAGAAAVQNIGAYGVEVKDVIERVHAVDLQSGERRTFSNADCHYAYRQSIFKQELRGRYAVTYVDLRLSKTFTPHLDYGNVRASLPEGAELTPHLVRQVITAIRREKLPEPGEVGSAGSFFMNPVVSEQTFRTLQASYPAMPHYATAGGVKIPAGWMIDQCGWKGQTLGRAGVHAKQALVLINCGGATGAEVVALSDRIRADVKQRFGVDIHPEVNIL